MKYFKVQIHKLILIIHCFIILSQFLTVPKKDKIRSIHVSRKWKHQHIKSDSKTFILFLYFDFFHIISLSLCRVSYVFQEYPELKPKYFSTYQVLYHITHCQDLQKTTHCQHQIPQNHTRLTKSLWTYRNHLTLTFILTL